MFTVESDNHTDICNIRPSLVDGSDNPIQCSVIDEEISFRGFTRKLQYRLPSGEFTHPSSFEGTSIYFPPDTRLILDGNATQIGQFQIDGNFYLILQ